MDPAVGLTLRASEFFEIRNEAANILDAILVGNEYSIARVNYD